MNTKIPGEGVTMGVTAEVIESNRTAVRMERSDFDIRLLVPHILLATVLILLLVLSFIQYHIKFKKKQSHAQYQEYLQLVQRSRVRRVSIPMTKVMRRFSQGQSLGNQIYFQDGNGQLVGMLQHKLTPSSKSDALLATNRRSSLEDSMFSDLQQKRPSCVSLPPSGSNSARTVSFYFPSDSSEVNERTELTNNYV